MSQKQHTKPTTLRRPADAEVPDADWLRRAPKTDLHCHLGGGIRLSTILDEATRQGIDLPAKDEATLRPYVVKDQAESLEDYLKAFKITESVMKDAEALERVAYELCEDAHRENVRVL